MNAATMPPEGTTTARIEAISYSVAETKKAVRKAIERLEQQTKSKRIGEKSNES